MARFDLPLADLFDYRPALVEPPDLDRFWQTAIESSRSSSRPAVFHPVETGLTLVETFDVEFSGADGDRIRGWLHRPRRDHAETSDSVVVEFVGAGGGRGLPHEPSLWALSGRAHFIMDNRGQGSGWRVGDTPDPRGGEAGAPSHPGFTTRGILDPHQAYYRRLYLDAVLAVDAVKSHPGIDPERVYLAGMSQGGGIALGAAAFSEVRGVLADVPFLCDFPRGVEICDSPPFAEVGAYLAVHRDAVERVFHTLSYLDAAILGRRASAPALFSVGLCDQVCPPSTVFAAYNNYGGPASIEVFPFNGHEGGGSAHDAKRLAWVAELDGR